MVAVTICSDFGAQEYKACHGFHFSPFYLPWNDGTMQIESENESYSVMSDSLWPHGLYSPWNFPGQTTEVGNRSLLLGIAPTQGFNPCLLNCRWVLYQLSHQGSPRILQWVAYPFSRDLPTQESNPHCRSPALQVDSLPAELSGKLYVIKLHQWGEIGKSCCIV